MNGNMDHGTEVRDLEVVTLRVIEDDGRLDAQGIAELADSMKGGLLQPLLVRPITAKGKVAGGWEVVAGRRRLAAAKLLGWERIACSVRSMDDADALAARIVENDQREDLHPLDQAQGYARLRDALAGGAREDGVQMVAGAVGRPWRHVWDRLRLLKLVPEARKLFRADAFPLGHALALATLPAERQKAALDRDANALFRRDVRGFFDGEDGEQAIPPAPRTLEEFKDWIAAHVRLDLKQKDVAPVLFPEALGAVAKASDAKERVVHLTHETFVPEDARDEDERTFGPRSWKRADGSRGAKTCERSVTGVVVVGPGRGEAFRVCVDKKKCRVHWPLAKKVRAIKSEQEAAAKDRAAIEAARKREAAEEAARKLWEADLPAIMEAVAKAVAGAPVGPKSALGQQLISAAVVHRNKYARKALAVGSSAESLCRWLAFMQLAYELNIWNGHVDGPKRLKKLLGLDLGALRKRLASERAKAGA